MKITATAACFVLLLASLILPARAQEQLLFQDASIKAGVTFVHNALPRGNRGMGMNTGAAWFDYDRDADLDLYVTQGVGSNALYRNNGDGTFTDVAELLGAGDSTHVGAGVAVGDYNNDGWPDLFLANADRDVLLQNQRGEEFIDVSEEVGIFDELTDRGTSASWGDFNNDGFLDVYVTNHFSLFTQGDTRQDRLYMNNQGQSFTDVSAWLGLDNLQGFGFIGTWTDYDNDGDLDLFVINDCGFSEIFDNAKLFRNDGAGPSDTWRFAEVSEQVDADACHNGMGIAVGDYDRDGFQEYFYTNIGEKTLLLDYASGAFYNAAEESGVYAYHREGRQPWTWGANFFDYDLDGWLDLYVAAGTLWLQTNPLLDPQHNMLFRNRGDGTFEDVSAISGVDDPGRSRSPVFGDYDGDGDVDLFLVNSGHEGYLFENTAEGTNHYLIVDLEGVRSNRDGIGAKLKLTTPDGGVQYWETRSGSSLGGGDDRAAYFGLGTHDLVTSLEITWPSGIIQMLENLNADQRLLVREPVVSTNRESAPAIPTIILNAYPNPFRDALYLDVQSLTRLTIEIYDVLGRRVMHPLQVSGSSQIVLHSQMDLSSLPAGLYFVRGRYQGQTLHQTYVVKR